MRTYKVVEGRPNGLPPIEQTFDGFDRNFRHSNLEYVALFSIDGIIEVWAVEGPHTLNNLIEYLSGEEYFKHGGIAIGCFKKVQIGVT